MYCQNLIDCNYRLHFICLNLQNYDASQCVCISLVQTSTLLTQFAVDQGVCSLYIITFCSNNQAMRTKEVITKEQMS